MQSRNTDKIDFVITWVDGSDPEWQKERAAYQENAAGDKRARRYRDWDNLQYLFRGIEKFAPWVNKVFFVTWGHLPKWLNTDHPKLRIITHKEFIPAQFLPTFSSRAIDMNFHRIPELSERFVYFNDDMFLTAPVEPRDFFMNGLPCDTAICNALYFGYSQKEYSVKTPLGTEYIAPAMDLIPINHHFDKRDAIRKNWRKWFSIKYGFRAIRTILLAPWEGFTGFMSYHLPYSYLKSTYREVWEREPELLTQSCMHKFRIPADVNHWVFSYWQLAKGSFSPRSPKMGKQFGIYGDITRNLEAISALSKGQYKFICLNDSASDEDFKDAQAQVNAAFRELLPNKSDFER